MTRPKLLLTNDDGIHAPGLKALWNCLRDWADVVVVAPADEQSAKSLSLTTKQPLFTQKHVWEHNTTAWSVSGTPADCVKIALNHFVPWTPDLVLSGINHGSNAGSNVLHSGTVGAVIEGTLRDIPGVAFSSQCLREPNFALATPWIPKVVQYALDHPPSTGTLLNVNFPSKGEIQGVRLARQGRERIVEDPERRQHPGVGEYFWLGYQIHERDEPENSDISYLRQGYATVVPIHIGELTDHRELAERRSHFSNYFRRD